MADLTRIADELDEMVRNAEARIRQRLAHEMIKEVKPDTLLKAAGALVAAQNTKLGRPGKQLRDCPNEQLEAAVGLIAILRGAGSPVAGPRKGAKNGQ